jgi:hypothetical protein
LKVSFLQNRWNRMSPRWRLCFLVSATCAAAVLATILLLRKGGVREVLYKAF